jgi:hypothetical protein
MGSGIYRKNPKDIFGRHGEGPLNRLINQSTMASGNERSVSKQEEAVLTYHSEQNNYCFVRVRHIQAIHTTCVYTTCQSASYYSRGIRSDLVIDLHNLKPVLLEYVE